MRNLKFIIIAAIFVVSFYILHSTFYISTAHAFHCAPGATLNCGHCGPNDQRYEGEIFHSGCSTQNPGYTQRYLCKANGQLEELEGGARNVQCDRPGSVPATSNIKTIFGEITPPAELLPFTQKGGAGAGGISLFLNNLITLIYIIAAVVFVFMIIWAALEWILSGGDKEKVSAAQKRITHAVIGIILFATAYAIIRTVGIFTGFSFFNTQQTYYWDPNANSGRGGCFRSFSPEANRQLITQEVSAENCPNRP